MTSKQQLYTSNLATNIDEQFILEWKALWEKSANATVFNSVEWFLTCIQADSIKEFLLVAVYNKDRLVGVLPLKKSKKFFIPVVSVLSSHFQVDTAFLIEKNDSELLEALFSYLMKKYNIYIPKIDENAVTLLQTLFPQVFFTLLSVNPIISFKNDPFLSASQSTMQQIRKIIRKNADQLSFSLYDGSHNLSKQLQIMFRLEQSSSKKTRKMDIFSDKKNVTFFRTICRKYPDAVRIGFLYYEKKPIAYQFGFLTKNVFIAFQTAYLFDYRKLRPGKTMLYYLIAKLKEDAVTLLDFGGGISNYKLDFTHEYTLFYDFYYSNNSLILFWWKLINKARRMKQVLHPEKNTRDHEFLFKELV